MPKSCRLGIATGLVGLVAAGSACAEALPEDALSRRCIEALEVREPGLAVVRVVFHRSPSPTERTLHFEATMSGAALRVEDELRCAFAADDPWTLRAMALGARRLSPGEVALVNSGLLLRDLSEHPERLARDTPGGGAGAR